MSALTILGAVIGLWAVFLAAATARVTFAALAVANPLAF
tara:strand:- start:1555 stop:1671 length:117 start_codon:yes stop_codon:yes gene_type:complete